MMTHIIKWGYLYVAMTPNLDPGWSLDVPVLHDFRTDCEKARMEHVVKLRKEIYDGAAWVSKECTHFSINLKGGYHDWDAPTDVWMKFVRDKE